ncbi:MULTISPECIES: AmmeMemoRadiSam system radical SAM enzyme [unclassified Carboxylicivirga]|uniref:AmmeMemoRadiSam system radical SAM enzyme n=1 Tax=Carboxylicivirga TaxID=1628153 RepID=UPI003D32A7A6
MEKGCVVCELCPHGCRLQPGQTGICRTRTHNDGQLISTAYGKACALHVDPVEKKPLYHFLPGTQCLSIAMAGCNLRCLNCQNHEISQHAPSDIDSIPLAPAAAVEQALSKSCASIAYTYTDPVAYYDYMLDTARLARQAGLKNLLVSAAYINPKPLAALIPFLDAANIDIKSFDEGVCRRLSGIRLQPVLNNLLRLMMSDVWLEITYLLIPGYSDAEESLQKFFAWLVKNGFSQVPLHLNRFVPNHRLMGIASTPLEQLLGTAEAALTAGMHYVYVGNIGSSKYSHSYCRHCKAVLIQRQAYRITSKLENGLCSQCGRAPEGVYKY